MEVMERLRCDPYLYLVSPVKERLNQARGVVSHSACKKLVDEKMANLSIKTTLLTIPE